MVSIIAIIAGLGYYLGSPLFLDTMVNEPPPVQLSGDNQLNLPGDAVMIESDSMQISGSFMGADAFHTASGDAIIIQGENGELYLRFEKFEVRNGPDLYVYLARNNDIGDGFVNLGRLAGNVGDQNYQVSPDIEISEFNTVLIWCQAFGVLFGSAEMT